MSQQYKFQHVHVAGIYVGSLERPLMSDKAEMRLMVCADTGRLAGRVGADASSFAFKTEVVVLHHFDADLKPGALAARRFETAYCWVSSGKQHVHHLDLFPAL